MSLKLLGTKKIIIIINNYNKYINEHVNEYINNKNNNNDNNKGI